MLDSKMACKIFHTDSFLEKIGHFHPNSLRSPLTTNCGRENFIFQYNFDFHEISCFPKMNWFSPSDLLKCCILERVLWFLGVFKWIHPLWLFTISFMTSQTRCLFFATSGIFNHKVQILQKRTYFTSKLWFPLKIN